MIRDLVFLGVCLAALPPARGGLFGWDIQESGETVYLACVDRGFLLWPSLAQ